jgi:hypothetical protein
MAPLQGIEIGRGADVARLAVEIGKNDSGALWMSAHAISNLTADYAD